MPHEEHVAILRQGVEVWNEWRRKNPTVVPDLRSADLSGVDYSAYIQTDTVSDVIGVNFENTQLQGAKLRETYFFDANLSFSNLTAADLSNARFAMTSFVRARCDYAHFQSADFGYSLLLETNFREADLRSASFTGALIRGADFTAALMEGTVFGDNDFSKTTGLDSVKHRGPSVIGIDAIYASHGRISEAFLRGCGVPESFITQMHSLVGAEDGIQFYSCFISYSTKDDEFAVRLHGRMRDAHLRVWFAPEDVQGGKKLHEQIETAIRVYDKLLIVLSEASLQSEWVMDELRKGFKAERDSGKRKLFPVRLTDYKTLQSWVCRDSLP